MKRKRFENRHKLFCRVRTTSHIATSTKKWQNRPWYQKKITSQFWGWTLISFRHIADGLDTKALQEKIDKDVIILPDGDSNTIRLYNVKYRLAHWNTNDWIFHNLTDGRDLRTVKYKKQRYLEVKAHRCHMVPQCKDGVPCNGSEPCSGIHDSLFFEDSIGRYHLEPDYKGEIIFVGLKWKKRYY